MAYRRSICVKVFLCLVFCLSTGQSQRETLPETKLHPNQLKCEKDVCTSGHPSLDPAAMSNYNCILQEGEPDIKNYTTCDVLRRIEYLMWWTFAYGERILVDITALANVTSSQHSKF